MKIETTPFSGQSVIPFGLRPVVLNLLLLCSLPGTVLAQDSIPRTKSFNLKFNPLALAEQDGVAEMAVEFRATRRSGFQLQGGYVFDKENRTYVTGQQGLRVRAEYRFYVRESQQREDPLETYIAVDVFSKMVWQKRYGFFGDFQGDTYYFSEHPYTLQKTIIGSNLKAGMLLYPSASRKWFVEVFAGTGLRMRNFEMTRYPPEAETYPLHYPVKEKHIINKWQMQPSVVGSVKLGIILCKKRKATIN